MPSKSVAQHNFMEMVANDPAAAKRVGVKPSVGQDFANADQETGNFRGAARASMPQHVGPKKKSKLSKIKLRKK